MRATTRSRVAGGALRDTALEGPSQAGRGVPLVRSVSSPGMHPTDGGAEGEGPTPLQMARALLEHGGEKAPESRDEVVAI